MLNSRDSAETSEEVSFLSEGEIHDRRLLTILYEGLASLKPLNDKLTVILRLEELVDVFDDLLFDVLGRGGSGSDLEHGLEELLS